MSWLFKSDDEPSSSASKQDLGLTISRQLRGVAAFLAPPPPSSSSAPSNHVNESVSSEDSPTKLALVGIRNDLAEIGGNLKSGISNLVSNLLQLPNYQGDRFEGFDKVAGISEQVVDFATKISTRPACWTDFPLSLQTEFELSEAQREHASAIETLVPSLVAVKDQVSSCINDQHFWLIYFILLMPRLNGHDFELLATCKVSETRDQLLLKLEKKETTGSSQSSVEETSSSRETEAVKGVIDNIEALQIEISDESSVGRGRSFRDEEEEIISLSDFDVEGSNRSSTMKRRVSNASSSSDWVQLNKSQGGNSKDSEGDSSDWLPIGDSD